MLERRGRGGGGGGARVCRRVSGLIFAEKDDTFYFSIVFCVVL